MSKKHSKLDLSRHIRDGIFDTFNIWKEELLFIFKDSVVLLFFLIVPLVYPIIYSIIYNKEKCSNVPVVVIDNSCSSISRDFIRHIDASPEVAVVAHCPDMPHAKEWLNTQQAFGIIYIPREFSKDLHDGKQGHISMYCDMSNLLFYKAMVLTATEVSLDMGAELQIEKEKRISERSDNVTVYPVLSDHITMYNPTSGFASFLLPAVLILLMQQTLMIGICMLAGTARERSRFDSFIPRLSHHNGVMRLIIGKTMTYFMLYIVAAFYLVFVVAKIFDFPHIGNPGELILFIIPYLLSCIFFSLTFSCFMRDRETPMILFVFTSIIFMFLTGVSWPLDAFSPVLRWFAYTLPSTFGVQGFVKMNCMGASIGQVIFEYRALWIQVGIYFATACLGYKIQLSRRAKKGYINSTKSVSLATTKTKTSTILKSKNYLR